VKEVLMADDITPGDILALQLAPATSLSRAALSAARPILRRMLGLDELDSLHARASRGLPPAATFEAAVLSALDTRVSLHAAGPNAIPAAGPLIVAANHPTGMLDGLVLVELVRQARSDVRVLTSRALQGIPELAASCFFVDNSGAPDGPARSRPGLRAALLWLRGGGSLVLFPAGEVAWHSPRHHVPVDSPWIPTLGRLALTTRATIVPAYIEARNSWLFYAAGMLHPMLRTALLGRELLNKRRRRIQVRLGAPIQPEPACARRPDVATVTAQCREAVDRLGALPGPRDADIAPPVDSSLLARDVDQLPSAARLIASGVFDVYCANAGSLPHVLEEIGRLRELSFRRVGEGTGRARDLDRFDPHYQHLFVWNRARLEIAGAYRIGATDRIVPEHGIPGLYTTTLFRYDERMLSRLGPALELGRSFVRPEYQRNYSPLLLLWKGIGRLVAQSPRYRTLFGPVSISSRYQDSSQQLLRAFLASERSDLTLAELVAARNPPSPLAPPSAAEVAPASVDELDAAVARLEGTQGIPVLLRQYLRLNAAVLGFNVDPAFGDSLDALMMVDLMRLPSGMLERYLGREAKAFYEYHAALSAPGEAA
jgi:putative hemolysin